MDLTKLTSVHMRTDALASRLGRHLVRIPAPLRALLLGWITRREGGQLTSETLRAHLLRDYDVEVGAFSYGSLLEPGRSDRGLRIGRYVSIGPGVRRFGAAHPIERLSMHPYWYNPAFGIVGQDEDVVRRRCVIEHEAWIGADALILPGCTRIGVGAVIGAGAIVTHDVPDFAVVVGTPGRVRSLRLNEALRATLLDQQPWLHDPVDAVNHYSSISTLGGLPAPFATSKPREDFNS